MHELKHAGNGVAAEDAHSPAGPRPARNILPEDTSDATEAAQPVAKARRVRRRWAGDDPMLIVERKRLAVRELRSAYGRIKSDFSEAYEHCRNDAQRRALEVAHQAAKDAYRSALDERLLEDRGAWAVLASGFRPERARAERHLSRLVTADALMRILKRLALIETLLGALSA